MVIQLGNKNTDFGLSRAYLYAYRLGILSAFFLFLFAINLLFPISVDTNSAEGAALPSTTELAINTDYSSANLDFTTISSTGTFASSSAEDIAKFTVTTNNYTGYTLTLAGNDDTGQLNNISAGAALDSIATSGIESSSFSTNEWGYLPSKYNSEANTTKYYSAPTTSDADTLDVTNAANSTANEYTIGLGAKVDYSKPAGTYTNTFILAAVGNPVNYTINYLDGTNDPTVQDLPTAQSSTTGSSSVVLNPNKTPTRTGYTFSKWCMGTVNTTAPSATDHTTGTVCTGTQYESGDSVSFIDQTVSTNALNLYALWTPNTYTITIKTAANIDEVSLNNSTCTSTNGCNVTGLKYNNDYTLTATPASDYKLSTWILSTPTGAGIIADTTSDDTTFTVGLSTNTITPTAEEDITYMQNWTGCTAMSTGDTITLTDKRDGEEYLVGKLADGNCWLLDNMRLDLTAVDLDNAIGTGLVGNTNATATALGYLKNGGGSSQYPISGVIAKTSSTGSWNTSYNVPYIATSGTDDGGWTKDTVVSTKYGEGSGKIGVYYNYCAASAGSYCYRSGYASGDASQDICPIGWRMPIGGWGGQYDTLYQIYSSDYTVFRDALSVSLSGSFDGGSRSQSLGLFWSSTLSYNDVMRVLLMGSSSINPGGDNTRTSGLSVRCISDKYIDMTMQEIGSLDGEEYENLLNNMQEGAAYITYDIRDGEQYKIAKLKDGNVWLLDNLRLDLTAVDLARLKGNTNATDQTLTYLKNGGGSAPYPANGVSTEWTVSTQDSYEAPYIATEYKNDIPTSYNSSLNMAGVYYNYCAASAGSYCYAENMGNGNMTQDICPVGWFIPTGGPNGQYQALASKYSNSNEFRRDLSMVLSGKAYNGNRYSWNEWGMFASSTIYDKSTMYNLTINSSTIAPTGSDYRYSGISVRCILRDPSSLYMTMQEIGNLSNADKTALLSSMVVGRKYTAIDSRDDQTYIVAKLKDGKLWMGQDLNLGDTANFPLKQDIDQSNTHLSTSTTISKSTFGGSSWKKTSGSSTVSSPEYISVSGMDSVSQTRYGTLYNYCAASVKTVCTTSTVSATSDLCPVGWRLPTGGPSGEFKTLYTNYYNSYLDMRNSLSNGGAGFALAGTFRSGAPSSQNEYSAYWSSVAYGTQMYIMAFTTSSVGAQGATYKYDGASVRCILNS